ncbi:MAG: MerR family transcriptional regulator [Candidatus Omnitrophota bacterium]|jgi:effector-binding domain-containing protein|nr:MAG: MerR family transcriptional regulator [Candidatus Omnitrophota bacterium]
MFSIGEFSRITGLSIKALRLYHEKGILVPHRIDQHTGYRYYNHQNVEKARVIQELKALEFSLAEIQNMLEHVSEEAEIIEALENQKDLLSVKIENYTKIVNTLDSIITNEKEMQKMSQQQTFEVVEKLVEDQLIAGIRFKGKYCDCGKAIGKICRSMGRYMCGKPFNLYYDAEYKEDDADIESCIPVKQSKPVEGIDIRTLPGGKCISLIHKGPYEELGRSYEKIIAYAKEKDLKLKTPSREIYLKGPGMIFRGNPKKYLTEIQMMIDE